MRQHPQISIVIPVYKTEQFLQECVNSILQQTYSDYEIILVDDGSPDKSGEICDHLASTNPQIHVLHQENQGVTRARANGVNMAKGEWICFVDSDDTLPIFALEKMAHGIHENTDIIVGFLYEYPNLPKEMKIEEYRKNCITAQLINSAPFPKLFRRNLFASPFILDIPRHITKGEDMLMNIRLAFATEKNVCLIPHKVYNYRIHNESCMQRFIPTTDYEHAYQIERRRSIPVQAYKQYQKYCIQSRLQALRQILKLNYSSNWRSSDFVKELTNEIKETHYPLGWKDRVVLRWGWILKLKK